jgi:hypothetical protein
MSIMNSERYSSYDYLRDTFEREKADALMQYQQAALQRQSLLYQSPNNDLQAKSAPVKKADTPQPNLVLLLTGDDE